MKVIPSLSENVQYETNVFRQRSRAESDIITRTAPGLSASMETGGGVLRASTGVRFEILRFLELGREDNEHTIAFGDIKLQFTKLSIGLRDDFTRTSDPPGGEFSGRINSTTNVGGAEAEYKLTQRFSTSVKYAWTHINFDKRFDALDRDEQLGEVSVFWKFLPDADLRLGYGRAETTYKFPGIAGASKDFARNIYHVGVRGDITSKLSSTLRIGYEQRDREGNDQREGATTIIGGDVIFTATDKTRLTLVADRSFQESIFATARYYVATSGTLIVEHRFTPKISTNVRFTATDNDYPSKDNIFGDPRRKARSDTILGWGGGVDYEIAKWLLVGGEYSHSRRNSNFEQFNYKDDLFSAKISLQF